MKIIIGVTSSISYILVRGQIAFLTSHGHEVYFVASPDSEVQADVAREGGVFIPIKMEREINLYKDLISLWKIRKMLRTIKPDIINVSTPKAGLLFTLASKLPCSRAGHKTVFTLRGLRSDTLIGLKRNIIKTTETICCSLADKVIVISPTLKNHAVKRNILEESKAFVIGKGSSNGINLVRFSKNASLERCAQEFRKYNQIPDDAVVFGYVGRMVNDKGLRELYEAFRTLARVHNDVYLLLAGSQDEADLLPQKMLEEMSRHDKIIQLDHTDNVAEVYAAMDVFVLFSYREGFGNVALEASAMQLPVIVASIPGLIDTVVDGETGFLATPKDTQDLQRKMEIFCKNRKLISLFGTAGRRRVENYFTNEKIWNGQLKLYIKLFSKAQLHTRT